MPYVAVRLRGHVKRSHDVEKTLQMLGLRKVNTMTVLPETAAVHGMLRKVEDFVTYGTISADEAKSLRPRVGLSPPRGGLKSLRQKYPRGELGFRGDAIKKFVERM
jgi:large subunit ribosomal protein L30